MKFIHPTVPVFFHPSIFFSIHVLSHIMIIYSFISHLISTVSTGKGFLDYSEGGSLKCG